MKQVEIRLNISAVAPLLDIIKVAADDLRTTLAIPTDLPDPDAEFHDTWMQDLMAAQNSDVRELLGLFDSDFFTDGAIANGQEPWLIPDPSKLKAFPVTFRTEPDGYQPYRRNEKTLARDWVRPGTKGLEHRIGGLEKDIDSGNISYDPANH